MVTNKHFQVDLAHRSNIPTIAYQPRENLNMLRGAIDVLLHYRNKPWTAILINFPVTTLMECNGPFGSFGALVSVGPPSGGLRHASPVTRGLGELRFINTSQFSHGLFQ